MPKLRPISAPYDLVAYLEFESDLMLNNIRYCHPFWLKLLPNFRQMKKSRKECFKEKIAGVQVQRKGVSCETGNLKQVVQTVDTNQHHKLSTFKDGYFQNQYSTSCISGRDTGVSLTAGLRH